MGITSEVTGPRELRSDSKDSTCSAQASTFIVGVFAEATDIGAPSLESIGILIIYKCVLKLKFSVKFDLIRRDQTESERNRTLRLLPSSTNRG